MDYARILHRMGRLFSKKEVIIKIPEVTLLNPLFQRYEIEEREWSNNALYGIRKENNYEGKEIERKLFMLTFCGIPKKEADKLVKNLKEYYEAQGANK